MTTGDMKVSSVMAATFDLIRFSSFKAMCIVLENCKFEASQLKQVCRAIKLVIDDFYWCEMCVYEYDSI